MKKGIVALLVLVLAGGAAGGGYYYWKYVRPQGENGGRVSSDSENAVYVDSVSVLAGLGSGNGLIQRFSGVVEPQKTWEVKLENERSVDECFVEVGDEVQEGQRLFTYDTMEDENKVATAEIELERFENAIQGSKNTISQLQRELARATTADEQFSISMQIRVEENTIKQNEYEYKVKELELEQMKEMIKESAVTSEISGIVKSINDPNSSDSSMSDSTDQAYITIVELGDYRVKGLLNEQNMRMVSEGTEMIVHSRVDETLTWRGTLTEIDLEGGNSNSDTSAVNVDFIGGSSDRMSSSTNYPFYVELENSDGLILGQHVYMEPDLGQEDQKDGIWLDDYYFATAEDGSSYVWAASRSNVLEKRAVTLGEYDEELCKYEVLDGLDEDDYITVPDENLTEGLPVVYNEFSDSALSALPVYGDSGYDDGSYEDGGYEEGNIDGMDYEEPLDGMDYDILDGGDEDGLDDGSIEELNDEDIVDDGFIEEPDGGEYVDIPAYDDGGDEEDAVNSVDEGDMDGAVERTPVGEPVEGEEIMGKIQ